MLGRQKCNAGQRSALDGNILRTRKSRYAAALSRTS